MSNKKIPNEQVKEIDLTEERRKRCEPIVKEVLQKMLDHKILFNDANYITQVVSQYLDGLFRTVVIDHANEIIKLLSESLKVGFEEANKRLWDKDRDEVSLKDIDDILRRKKE